MKTSELYKQFQKELQERLESWISEQFAESIDKIGNIGDTYSATLSCRSGELVELFVKSYPIEEFEKNLRLYKGCKEDFFEIIVDNFTAQFMDKMYNWFTNLNIKFDKNLDPKVLEMITDGRCPKSENQNDEPF